MATLLNNAQVHAVKHRDTFLRPLTSTEYEDVLQRAAETAAEGGEARLLVGRQGDQVLAAALIPTYLDGQPLDTRLQCGSDAYLAIIYDADHSCLRTGHIRLRRTVPKVTSRWNDVVEVTQ